MCRAVVVVESDLSGGSMITARFAGEQGRLIFAVPGRIDQPSSAGCHQLIRDGATLLTSVDDILSELNYLEGFGPAGVAAIPENASRTGVTSGQMAQANLTDDERRVVSAFAGGAILSVDALVAVAGLAAHQLSSLLMMLELKRVMAKRSDGCFELR